jgi:hypothetical protein|tara:strand:+ start:34 stop:294 length:261 start_codon:yes stop_codon:yes gene_type:complete
MENKKFYQDSRGDVSSKRIFGSIGMIYFFILAGVDGFGFYNLNETIIIGGMGICAGLLGLDSITDIWKVKTPPAPEYDLGEEAENK